MGSVGSGLAALLGGAGQGVNQALQQQNILRNQRDLEMMRVWETGRDSLANILATQMTQAKYPMQRSSLADLIGKVYSAKPGDDIGKLMQQVQTATQLHPATAAAISSALPQAPPTKPGPAAVGQPQGTGIQPAAQSPTNPTQPSQQTFAPMIYGGSLNGPLKNTAPPATAPPEQSLLPVGQISSEASPTAPTALPPIPSPQAAGVIPGLPEGIPQPQGAQAILRKYMQMPEWQTPAGSAALLPFAQQEILHDQALQEKLEEQQATLAYRRQAFAELQKSPIYPQLSPYVQGGYLAQVGGLAPVQMPGMTMMPRLLSTGTLGKDAPPGTVEFGTNKPVQSGTRYRVMALPATNEVVWQPEEPETVVTQTRNGEQLSNKQTGEQQAPLVNAVPPAQNTPYHPPTAGGGIEQTTAADVNANVPPVTVPNAVSPALASVQRVSQVSPTGQTTSVVRRVFGSSAAQPPSGAVATHGSNGQPLGTPDFQQRVKTIADTLLIPNQSEAQKNNAFKMLVGPERSPLAEAVRSEITRRQAADPGPLSWDIGTAERAQLSTQALQHIAAIESLINKLGDAKQLGPVMSRWNEFWTGKVGEDLTTNQDYTALANNVDLLTKVMGRIHGGAKGGGSIQMIDSFAKKLSVGKMDEGTLKSAIGAERDWLTAYANPKQTAVPQVAPGPGASTLPVVQWGRDAQGNPVRITGQSAPAPPAPSPAPSGQYTEAEVRSRAAAQGVNPDTAVAAARAKGLIK